MVTLVDCKAGNIRHHVLHPRIYNLEVKEPDEIRHGGAPEVQVHLGVARQPPELSKNRAHGSNEGIRLSPESC